MMDNASKPLPQKWVEALDRAEADVAAGRVVDGAEIHRDLDASIKHMLQGTNSAPKRPASAR